MGRFILESTKMKVLIAGLLCATVAMALPEGRRLRAEEHWRPAQGRDLSKYKPRQATVPATAENLAWAIKEVKKTGASTKKTTNVDLKATCGIEGPARAGRIVGGHEAEEHQWTWQVALFIDDAWFCGGSLINENYVLTAAHCVDGASYFDIMAGAHNVRASSEPNRVEVTSYNGWTHPLWNSNDLSGDLALIELPSPMPMNDYISASCLPATGETPAVGSPVTVTGWGKPSDTAGGRGSCNGDSGGPLVQKAGGKAAGDKWTQVGIVSFGASAGCEVGMPAGFTRTEYYLDWIKSETGMP